jgi:hypothetical protein
MTNIVDRLRYLAGVSGYPDAFMCAVEAIEDLRAENANLRDDVHNQASDNSVLRQRLDIASLRARLAEAERLLLEAVDIVESCHDCIRMNAPALHARINTYLSRKEGEPFK